MMINMNELADGLKWTRDVPKIMVNLIGSDNVHEFERCQINDRLTIYLESTLSDGASKRSVLLLPKYPENAPLWDGLCFTISYGDVEFITIPAMEICHNIEFHVGLVIEECHCASPGNIFDTESAMSSDQISILTVGNPRKESNFIITGVSNIEQLNRRILKTVIEIILPEAEAYLSDQRNH